MSGQKQEEKKQKPLAQQNDGDYESEEEVQDQQIQDDGEVSSEHSSINLEEYLKHRDNIPDDPSDAQEEEQSQDQDYQAQDESQEQQGDYDEQEESQEVKPKGKAKASKRDALKQKKEGKAKDAKAKKDQEQ